MHKNSFSDLQSNQIIRDAIRKIALRGIVSPDTGAVRGTGKVTGYVAKIHKDGELAGTVDVQEYTQLAMDEAGEMKMGYHEGVLISALQDNSQGMVIIPKMYSEVVVSKDADTGVEYVSMFSHVDVIQLDSHESVVIAVREREEYQADDEEGHDVEELEPTGVYAKTSYTKDTISTQVVGEADNDEKTTQQLINGGSAVLNAAGKTIVTSDAQGHHVTHDKTKLELGDSEATLQQDSSKVKVTNGTVYVGSDSGTDDAVLGGALCDVLMDLCGYLAQVKTTTQLGPQPFINMAQFIALKSKIQSAKASHSNFLTKKVQIQK